MKKLKTKNRKYEKGILPAINCAICNKRIKGPVPSQKVCISPYKTVKTKCQIERNRRRSYLQRGGRNYQKENAQRKSHARGNYDMDKENDHELEERICLGVLCQGEETFMSEGVHNRVCIPCTNAVRSFNAKAPHRHAAMRNHYQGHLSRAEGN